MEEDNELEMGLFDQDFNLNLDQLPEYEEQESTEEVDENINVTEDNSSEEVGDEEDVNDEGGDDEQSSDSSSNLYSSLASVVYEQGLLPSLDISNEKIESVEDLVNVFKREQEIQAKNILDEYISNLDVSKIAQSKQEIQSLGSITEDTLKEDLDLAKQLIYKDYINQGLGEKKASHLLKRLIDLGDDAILEDAVESLGSLKEFQSRQIELEKENSIKQLELERKEQIELEENLKKVIYENKEPLKGFKATKPIQDKVYKSITEIVGKSPDGIFENKFMKERRENPIEFEARMYYMYELTNGFKDYSKIATAGKSNAVKDLEKIAKSTKIQDNGVPTWSQDPNSYGSNFVFPL